MNKLQKHLSRKIRELRVGFRCKCGAPHSAAASGLSQVELAKAIGVAPNTISRWEAGATWPRADDIFNLAEHLGVSVTVFFCRSTGSCGRREESAVKMTQLTANEIERNVTENQRHGRESVPFVKLDCGILTSTIWDDYPARSIFLTALLMAEPREYTEPVPQIEVGSLEYSGWSAPPGWYGFVAAAGIGIIRRAGDVDQDAGFAALERLGNPEVQSRSQDHEGRRMIRINGGYLVLNYDKYRERDYGAAERMRRLRARRKDVPRNGVTVPPNVTHTESREQRAEALEPSSSSASHSQDQQLASLLLSLIRTRNPEHKEPNLEAWSGEISRMVRLDNRNRAEIRRIIEWSQANHFWQNNILSPKKLREKFDQLVLQSKQQPEQKRQRTPVTGEDFSTVNR